jgi:cellulose synthase/poly-beta-1,6-N-acetylglucosamine synthase-like glycosyltransferase
MTLSSNGETPPAPVGLLAREPETPAERLALLRRLLGEPACRQLGLYPIPAGFKLSVVIPVYNEERWIREVVRRVRDVEIPKEVLIVDDCSTDGTRAILKELDGGDVRVFLQPRNRGKGAACRTCSPT